MVLKLKIVIKYKEGDLDLTRIEFYEFDEENDQQKNKIATIINSALFSYGIVQIELKK